MKSVFRKSDRQLLNCLLTLVSTFLPSYLLVDQCVCRAMRKLILNITLSGRCCVMAVFVPDLTKCLHFYRTYEKEVVLEIRCSLTKALVTLLCYRPSLLL